MNDDRETGDPGFERRTRLAEAIDRFETAPTPTDRTETVAVASADGRALSGPVAAARDVPGYTRVAADGYAVRAEDTFDAGDRSPARLAVGDGSPGGSGRIDAGEAVRVAEGDPVPDGADAVVPRDAVELEGVADLAVFASVTAGENVAAVGTVAAAGEEFLGAGYRLDPPDLGLLAGIGHESVEVFARPTVAVLPVGDRVVEGDPGPGEVPETDGTAVAGYVRRWGGDPERSTPVGGDREAVASALDGALDADVVATVGKTGSGAGDSVPAVLAERGDLLVHGAAIDPGSSVALASVDGTPVVALPGAPAACVVGAVQFLRLATKVAGGLPRPDYPTMAARLGRKIRSEPGVRTFARVRFAVEDGQRAAVPTGTGGGTDLAGLAGADGWIEIAEGREGLPEGEVVAVQDWEWSA